MMGAGGESIEADRFGYLVRFSERVSMSFRHICLFACAKGFGVCLEHFETALSVTF
jgi:hypothetical protein